MSDLLAAYERMREAQREHLDALYAYEKLLYADLDALTVEDVNP